MTNGSENLGNGYRGVARPEMLLPEPDPVLDHGGWVESVAAPLAEHPLLHGLLMELPPKGCTPDAVWLDRWFEAARSILELIYAEPADLRR